MKRRRQRLLLLLTQVTLDLRLARIGRKHPGYHDRVGVIEVGAAMERFTDNAVWIPIALEDFLNARDNGRVFNGTPEVRHSVKAERE